jgi:hypothetical protein
MMKHFLVTGLLIISFTHLHGQGHFPLQIGNIWQMKEMYAPPYQREQWKILGDSLLPNGMTYYHFSGAIASSNLLRENGPLIYAYNAQDTTEFILFDFDASVGDTMNMGTPPMEGPLILTAKDTVLYFGKNRTRWTFGPTYSIWFGQRQIVDSIGIQYVWIESDQNLELEGAVLDGVQYGTVTSIEPISPLPSQPTLYQNTPNPFNPSTNIRFYLPKTAEITIAIYSITGHLVTMLVDSEIRSLGDHSITWNAEGIATGVYFCQLRAPGYVSTSKLILLR